MIGRNRNISLPEKNGISLPFLQDFNPFPNPCDTGSPDKRPQGRIKALHLTTIGIAFNRNIDQIQGSLSRRMNLFREKNRPRTGPENFSAPRGKRLNGLFDPGPLHQLQHRRRLSPRKNEGMTSIDLFGMSHFDRTECFCVGGKIALKCQDADHFEISM